MMNSNQKDEIFDPDNELEKWLESLFLDPNTSFLDQSQFRIDLYDSETEMIIEALLPNYSSANITIFINDSHIIIKACESSGQTRERTVTFPFVINAQKVNATYSNDILEISISKKQQVQPKNRQITLT
ncbi:Hsp20/alpha crystallin family protein [Neobacillus sp. D3-1R]|uniref:Hsp20/alpha crystallin family protein n=1 Tax=Neobacillus sp. D3-1R TaxID=3445778 RepID=UPI003F9F8AB0